MIEPGSACALVTPPWLTCRSIHSRMAGAMAGGHQRSNVRVGRWPEHDVQVRAPPRMRPGRRPRTRVAARTASRSIVTPPTVAPRGQRQVCSPCQVIPEERSSRTSSPSRTPMSAHRGRRPSGRAGGRRRRGRSEQELRRAGGGLVADADLEVPVLPHAPGGCVGRSASRERGAPCRAAAGPARCSPRARAGWRSGVPPGPRHADVVDADVEVAVLRIPFERRRADVDGGRAVGRRQGRLRAAG